MQELLTAIKAQLRADLSYIRSSDIFITPLVGYIPDSAKPPCIGIKDGPVTRTDKAGGVWEERMVVKLAVYVQLLKPEASIMGDAGSGKKGVLEIVKDVHESLDENLLNIIGMHDASVADPEPESELFGDENELLQRKIITYEYTKERNRP